MVLRLARTSLSGRLLLGLAATAPMLTSCDDRAREPPSDPMLVDLLRETRRTNELLRAIETAIEARQVETRQREDGDATRAHVAPSGGDLSEALAPIRQELAEISKRLPTGSMGAGRQPSPPKQETALAQAAAQYEAHENDAKRAHFLWDRHDVLEAYGYPDSAMTSGNRNSIWIYSLSSDRSSSLVFEFEDGLVIRSSFQKNQ